MAWKNPEKQREAIRKHYAANRAYYMEKAKKRKQSIRDYVHEIKNRTPCTDCGTQYPYYVTDFDHLGDKNTTVSQLINKGSLQKVKEEIRKCELVCSNCHKKRTYKRRTNKNTV
jgi:hypothetical protein